MTAILFGVMTQVDQFESIFRSALVDIYEYDVVDIHSVVLVTDKTAEEIKPYLHDVQRFLSVLGNSVTWTVLSGADYGSSQELLDRVAQEKPNLICSYRNLKSDDWMYKHSLGSYLDVLIHKAETPVLILPHPEADNVHDHALENTDNIMAITDHLSNDHRLINYAVRFAEVDGTVTLTHIEDELIFERYLSIIGKISTIDTEDARTQIKEQLLKEPQNYIESCKTVLQEHNLPVTLESLVTFGNHLAQYKRLIDEQKIDLLVMNTQENGQNAMHGMSYPLAVELRQIPLLML